MVKTVQHLKPDNLEISIYPSIYKNEEKRLI